MRTRTPSKKSLTDQASELVEQVSPHVDAARERIVNDYLPAAQTMLAEAREVAKDARVAAQDAAVKAERSTRKSRKKAAKNARSKAARLAAAAAATPAAVAVAEKVRPDSKKPRRKKRVMVLLGLAGLGAFLFKKMRGQQTATSSYQPPRPAPVPRPTAVADTPVATTPPAPPAQHFEPDPEAPADQGGAFLDEALADASEEPHRVTTPDRPADVEDVADAADPKKS